MNVKKGIVFLLAVSKLVNTENPRPKKGLYCKGNSVGQAFTDGLAFIKYHHKGKTAEFSVVWNDSSVPTPLSGKTPYAFVQFTD